MSWHENSSGAEFILSAKSINVAKSFVDLGTTKIARSSEHQ